MNDRTDRLRPGERWYVVQTLARREAGAELQLTAQGFRVFLPKMRKTIRHARKFQSVMAAVFPGYLFIALDPSRDRWRAINSTVGVARLITGDGVPSPVPNGVIETLFGCLDEDGVCRFDRDLEAGQNVHIVAGPFADMIGQLVHLDGRGRVRVLLEIMGVRVIATLDRGALRAV